MHDYNPFPTQPHTVSTREFIAAWEPDLMAMARSRTLCPATQEDAVQVGRIALLKAAQMFDPERGHSFKHYAKAAARNGISKEVQRHRRRDRLHGSNLAAVQSKEASPSVICMVREWLATLPEGLVRLFHAIYELGHTQREIACMLGVSQPRVAALHRELLDRARIVFVPGLVEHIN